MSWGKDEDGSIYVSPTVQPNGKWIAYEDYTRLKADAERLEHQVRYWRIEAETDNARWLRCLEDIERLRKEGKPTE